MTDGTSPTPHPDPVLRRRQAAKQWADRGQRLGYALFGLAVVLFVVALVTDLSGPAVTGVIASMALGSVVLAPAIVVGYGVKAADREDRERAAEHRRPRG